MEKPWILKAKDFKCMNLSNGFLKINSKTRRSSAFLKCSESRNFSSPSTKCGAFSLDIMIFLMHFESKYGRSR
ncbi:hypothetical protein CAEBREN_21840 [Caenorhabditis brenneri]|uniref:Uncharacterized protein n=1 Tax=Caenorhabditis brenneri TaxID=135651 RepID=G0N1H7_CAEBE|nr:hypothetical protein CAEBREN_21840 [Caenorhabditis brenneri]